MTQNQNTWINQETKAFYNTYRNHIDNDIHDLVLNHGKLSQDDVALHIGDIAENFGENTDKINITQVTDTYIDQHRDHLKSMIEDIENTEDAEDV